MMPHDCLPGCSAFYNKRLNGDYLVPIKQLFRLIHIYWVMLQHGLDEVILTTRLFRPLRFLQYVSPWYWYWLRKQRPPRAVRIRLCLQALGPIFVKFGQILSTRRDLLPDDIAAELAKLQDQVAPFPGTEAIAIIEKAYGRAVTEVFQNFDATPLASASIAQVHCATLHTGQPVVVKVVRPHIEKVIRRDVSLLYVIASLMEKYWKDGRRLRPLEVVSDYEKTILDELDLMKEAANASQLRRHFEDSPLLYVPEIYWDYTRQNVMAMERISGIPINDIEKLKAHQINFKELAEMGVEIFYTQVFRHSFFHADMHPGNIFVAQHAASGSPYYIAVDFGIMGTLSPTDRHYLAENFLAFFNRDYRRVAELHVESHWVPANTPVDQFESAIRTVCEPIFERPLKEISFGIVLLRLFQTARRFNMEVQPQLVLLQKTFLNIEGLGRQLYPDLDLWKTAKPYLERWVSEQIGTRAFLSGVKNNLPLWLEKMPDMPLLAHAILVKAAKGELPIHCEVSELHLLRQEMRHQHQRQIIAMIASALLISISLIVGLSEPALDMPGGIPLLAWIFGGVGCLLMVSLWRILR